MHLTRTAFPSKISILQTEIWNIIYNDFLVTLLLCKVSKASTLGVLHGVVVMSLSVVRP